MREIHESVNRLALAFGLSEKRAVSYVSELEAAGVDPGQLEEAADFSVRNLERCPTIADLIRRCAGGPESSRQLTEQETLDLIARRLRAIDRDRKITPELVQAHRNQFSDEFDGRFAYQASQVRSRATIMDADDKRLGAMLFALSKRGIVWDHARDRWTEYGEKPTPLSQAERDAMRFEGWRPPLPAARAIRERFERLRHEPAKPVSGPLAEMLGAITAEVPF